MKFAFDQWASIGLAIFLAAVVVAWVGAASASYAPRRI